MYKILESIPSTKKKKRKGRKKISITSPQGILQGLK
jgi:hypothetical protein